MLQHFKNCILRNFFKTNFLGDLVLEQFYFLEILSLLPLILSYLGEVIDSSCITSCFY